MPESGPLGGKNKTVEADETLVGDKAESRAFKDRSPKEAVLALGERGGKVRLRHVPSVSANTRRNASITHVDRASYVMIDEAPEYVKTGEEFVGHGTVNHSVEEYVRAYF